ncbi:MAG: hypothetical protein ACC654_07740 [Acidimicrobiia bacterium]
MFYVVAFTRDIAGTAARLGAAGSPYGPSLGDRVCLATALGAPAVTADRVWSEIGLDVAVISIR